MARVLSACAGCSAASGGEHMTGCKSSSLFGACPTPNPACAPCRWSCWNSLFLLFWVQASSVNPARSQRYRELPAGLGI